MPAILRCFRIAGFLFSKEGCYITQNEVNAVFDEQVRLCADTLKRKTKEYTGDDPDRLGAFKAAAALQHTTPQRALAGMLAKHIVSPVRFTQELAQMQADGADTFIEFGPKAVLTGLVKKTLKNVTAKNCESVATLEEVMA